jgi:hypothetical protein
MSVVRSVIGARTVGRSRRGSGECDALGKPEFRSGDPGPAAGAYACHSPHSVCVRLSPSLPSFAFPERVPPGSRRCSPEFFHLWPCSPSGFRPLQPSARASMHHTRATPRSPRVSFTGMPPSHCTSSLDATQSERTRSFSRTSRLRMDVRRTSSYASPPLHRAPRMRSRHATRMYSI